MPTHSYLVKLFQVARVHTESFTFEADSEESARKQAEELMKTKDITEKYDFEIEDLSELAAAGADTNSAGGLPAPEPEER